MVYGVLHIVVTVHVSPRVHTVPALFGAGFFLKRLACISICPTALLLLRCYSLHDMHERWEEEATRFAGASFRNRDLMVWIIPGGGWQCAVDHHRRGVAVCSGSSQGGSGSVQWSSAESAESDSEQ
jgi:hypothetical protein